MKALEKYLESDTEFAKEIISTFIDNLIEFRTSLLTSLREQEPKIFLESCHKMKTTLGFIQNEKLQHQVNVLHPLFLNNNLSQIDTRAQNLFCRICTSSINELEEKLTTYKTAV